MPDTIQVLTTVPDKPLAVQIGHTLVEARLAACVQVSGPVESVYRWHGKIETTSEWQCWIKTTRDRYAEVEQAIRRLHPYEVPEILALPVVEGHLDYIQWLERSLVDERSAGK
jgi:periplasmic divalent cation tolerance protein